MRTAVHGVRTIVFICTLIISTTSFSQSIFFRGRNEAGLGLGPSFFLGDIGGNAGPDISTDRPGGWKHLELPLTKFAKGAFVAIYPNKVYGLRVGITHTIFEAADENITDKGGAELHRKDRNLSFKTSALEGYLLAEIYPLNLLENAEAGVGLQPYLMLGAGVTKVNPKAKLEDKWVELKPLMLEGHGMEEFPDRKKYGSIVPSLNVGFGFKYYVGDNKFFGVEMLHRSSKGAGADMIDGVSTNYIDPSLFDKYLTQEQAAVARKLYFRENELAITNTTRPSRPAPAIGEQRGDGGKEKDAWFSSTLRFGWVLPDPNSPSGRQARQMRCPSFY